MHVFVWLLHANLLRMWHARICLANACILDMHVFVWLMHASFLLYDMHVFVWLMHATSSACDMHVFVWLLHASSSAYDMHVFVWLMHESSSSNDIARFRVSWGFSKDRRGWFRVCGVRESTQERERGYLQTFASIRGGGGGWDKVGGGGCQDKRVGGGGCKTEGIHACMYDLYMEECHMRRIHAYHMACMYPPAGRETYKHMHESPKVSIYI